MNIKAFFFCIGRSAIFGVTCPAVPPPVTDTVSFATPICVNRVHMNMNWIIAEKHWIFNIYQVLIACCFTNVDDLLLLKFALVLMRKNEKNERISLKKKSNFVTLGLLWGQENVFLPKTNSEFEICIIMCNTHSGGKIQ